MPVPLKSGLLLMGFGQPSSALMKALFLGQSKKILGLSEKGVSRGVNSNEKTVFLMIDVKDLLAGSAPSKVIYIFGYKSKKLIHVKAVWGKLAQKKPNIETIVSIATQLSNYFRQKRYKENGFASYRELAEELILVFQGKDQKARAARLLLSNPKNRDGEAGKNISLTLS